MTYRRTSKAKKLWSQQANAKQARERMSGEPAPVSPSMHHHMTITVDRHATNEKAVFELYEGDRCNNYRVYCNGVYQGVKGISKVMEGLRKALPAFLSESSL